MVEELILASGNIDKFREIDQVFNEENLGFKLVLQAEYGVSDIEETGTTFVENALLKARNAASHTDHWVLADDSGLMIDALDGAPGVRSARYAGEPVDFARNIEKVLHDMQGVKERAAQFVCVMVLMRHANDMLPLVVQSVWPGEITVSTSGSNGFGYDPIFMGSGDRLSAATLSETQKRAVSHRAQALRKVIMYLNHQLLK